MAYFFDSQKLGFILTIIVSYQSKARILLHSVCYSLCIFQVQFSKFSIRPNAHGLCILSRFLACAH
jgi:hypothetical protein